MLLLVLYYFLVVQLWLVFGKGKVEDTGGARSGGVSHDGAGDWGPIVVAKSKGNKMINKGKSGANGGATTASFESSIVRTARDMPKAKHWSVRLN